MEKEVRKKAIEQAQASLSIDKIYLSDEFINSYLKKHQLPLRQVQTKKLKRGNNNNGKH